LRELALVQRERCQTLKEMAAQSRYFYTDFENYDEAAAKKHLTLVILDALVMLREQFAVCSDWTKAAIQSAITTTAGKFDLNMGKLAQPLRVAITGGSVSPSIDDTVRLMGREKTLARLNRAVEYIMQRPTVA
ncbi:MAG: glutamyl-tRNA synthetase, partial [Gammaproteobacteria bacterium]|nr:glutamyl-tRNA synthetase [Gammaproteobacteria bacterium]